MTDHTQLDAMIESLGLAYQATFVPFSKSRNAKPDPKIKDLSINWRVSLIKNAAKIETDYTQGIGHLPNALKPQKAGHTIDETAAIRHAAEHGKYSPKLLTSDFVDMRKTPLPAPLLRDVLYSLVLDASALDAGSFEDWASEFGYDTDSRKAEATYQACMEIALKLRRLIPDAQMAALREAFQDY